MRDHEPAEMANSSLGSSKPREGHTLGGLEAKLENTLGMAQSIAGKARSCADNLMSSSMKSEGMTAKESPLPEDRFDRMAMIIERIGEYVMDIDETINNINDRV